MNEDLHLQHWQPPPMQNAHPPGLGLQTNDWAYRMHEGNGSGTSSGQIVGNGFTGGTNVAMNSVQPEQTGLLGKRGRDILDEGRSEGTFGSDSLVEQMNHENMMEQSAQMPSNGLNKRYKADLHAPTQLRDRSRSQHRPQVGQHGRTGSFTNMVIQRTREMSLAGADPSSAQPQASNGFLPFTDPPQFAGPPFPTGAITPPFITRSGEYEMEARSHGDFETAGMDSPANSPTYSMSSGRSSVSPTYTRAQPVRPNGSLHLFGQECQQTVGIAEPIMGNSQILAQMPAMLSMASNGLQTHPLRMGGGEAVSGPHHCMSNGLMAEQDEKGTTGHFEISGTGSSFPQMNQNDTVPSWSSQITRFGASLGNGYPTQAPPPSLRSRSSEIEPYWTDGMQGRQGRVISSGSMSPKGVQGGAQIMDGVVMEDDIDMIPSSPDLPAVPPGSRSNSFGAGNLIGPNDFTMSSLSKGGRTSYMQGPRADCAKCAAGVSGHYGHWA